MTHALEPGYYLVEMTFDKKVDPATLMRALAGMGWQDVLLDEGSGTTTGALPRNIARTISTAVHAAPVTSRTTATPTPSVQIPTPTRPAPAISPTIPIRAPAPTTVPAFSRQVTTTAPIAATVARAIAPPTAMMRPGNLGPPSATRPGILSAQRLGLLTSDVVKTAATNPYGPLATSPLPPGASPAMPGDVPGLPPGSGPGGQYAEAAPPVPSDGGGGGGASGPSDGGGGATAPSPGDDSGAPTPEQQADYDQSAYQEPSGYEEASGEETSEYQDGSYASDYEDTGPTDYGDPYATPEDLQAAYDEASPEDREAARQAAFNAAHEGGNQDVSSTSSLQDAFNAAHASSDVATAGEYLAIVSGIRSARDGMSLQRWADWGTPQHADHREVRARFRFLGKLVRPILMQDVPGREWLYVRYLSVEPARNLNFRVSPHPLHPGRTYEAVLVSRDKLTPHREEVKAMLARMGFQPMKVSLVQRNVRAPGKPTSSLSVWFALVRWLGPVSVSLIEDPFYFEQLQEVTPG